MMATVPTQMRAGLYYGSEGARPVEQPVPEIGAGEVLVSVNACGICGSDTMAWYREPQVKKQGGINTGHEITGVIVKVGDKIRDRFKAGQRVIVTHHFPCLTCDRCLAGEETTCATMHNKHIAPGGFAQYVRVFESGLDLGLYPLPEQVSFEAGTFVEPLGCVVRGMRKMAPIAGRSMLVIGSGLSGLLQIRLAKAMGAAHIIAVDTNQGRLDAARASGADETILASADPLPKADLVVVCAAAPQAARAALDAVNPGGVVMIFASDGPDKELAIPVTRFWLQQQRVLFTYGAAPRDMQEALDWIASGKVRVDDLVTHRFSIEQIGDAFDLATNPRDMSLKVIVEPHKR
jgi:L-iditol 2-dehydrogenase